ncbi:MAG: amidase [Ruminococcaceae bacterium]|nr:amidase [Oscillospiraceae bacterium]
MLVTKPYKRENAIEYARKFAFSQNSYFGNFRGIGGNCTNFVSQAIFAGSCQMNYTPTFGWYYISLNERSPSWTGVEYFYNFMVGNSGIGPFGKEVSIDELEIGDVIQLGRNIEGFYHTLLVVGFDGDDPLVAAQTDDAYMRPLSSYTYDFARYIKIEGVRYVTEDDYACFEQLINAPSVPNQPMDTAQ